MEALGRPGGALTHARRSLNAMPEQEAKIFSKLFDSAQELLKRRNTYIHAMWSSTAEPPHYIAHHMRTFDKVEASTETITALVEEIDACYSMLITTLTNIINKRPPESRQRPDPS
jgi:hypothetical protein